MEQLFHDKKNDEWTSYMSLKRQMIKKNNAAQKRVVKLLKKNVVKDDAQEDLSLKTLKKDQQE